MKNVYALFVVLTSDNNNTYCLSTDPVDLILPNISISNIEYLHDEARYHLRQFFAKDTFRFSEECDLNYISIQNSLSIDYLKNNDNFDSSSDLVITYGGILEKNNTNNHHFWNKLQYNVDYKGFTNNSNLNLLIDHVINKTII